LGKNNLIKDIAQIINNSLEIKRALAVKMYLQGYSYSQIADLLNVSQCFVEKWRNLYNKKGAGCFPVGYKGSKSFMTEKQKEAVNNFIKTKSSCRLEELISYLKNTFGISYKSKQSYYALLDNAGMSWKKTEKVNPKRDEEKVIAKKEALKKTQGKKRRNSLRGIGRIDGR
jgi:putative transposase